MTIWIDAQLSPQIARWISKHFELSAVAVIDLGLRDAEDLEIFAAAKEAACVVMTKDQDFITLLQRFGPPPQVIWLTCGNTSNRNLKIILQESLRDAVRLLETGEAVVEITSI